MAMKNDPSLLEAEWWRFRQANNATWIIVLVGMRREP